MDQNNQGQLGVILEKITNISKNQDSMATLIKDNQIQTQTLIDKIDNRTNNLEVTQGVIQTKISLFAGMQGVFSVIVGAVAVYLGGQK